jgi:type VII secretion-associated serine protease mycosin
MGVAKPAGIAIAGSLGMTSLVIAAVTTVISPASATATAARPEVKPTSPTAPAGKRSPSTKAAPRPTVTKTKTVAPPQQCSPQNGQSASGMTSEPYPQQMLNFTDVWPLTRGDHVKVAIVDSGVDTSHRQLPRIDTYDVTGTGKADCVGHGTMLAGIIAGQDRRSDHVPFLGAAPGVDLISIKVATQEKANSPLLLAQGIKRAANLGARIINVSSSTPNYPGLKSAVEYAQQSGALIVAAAGNTEKDKKASEQALYPASYDGVLSVGAVGKEGKVEDFTDTKSRVSILAPGKAVISTWPRNTYQALDGTSFAAPYVAATAALVQSYYPSLSAQQVKHRLEATADGSTSAGSGHGMLNPLRAVTAVLPEEAGQGRTTVKPRPVAILQPAQTDPFTRRMALALVGGALGIAGAVAAGGIIIPAGRRRNWRPGRREAAAEQEEQT